MKRVVHPSSTIGQALMVPIMNGRQRREYFALLSIWLLALAFFWGWWLRPEHVVSAGGMVITSLMLVWSTVLPAWYFYFAARMKRPNPALPVPRGRVAMVVTKAPSEPWPVVRHTLERMLAQDFPRPFDVWLADEDATAEVRFWCRRKGVQISCRKGASGYHNAAFPARQKCKEGNLRYFYDRFGYERYDFVVQLDADHAPEPDYLLQMIRPFADARVGYVAGPSICDTNMDDSWVCRARLYAEAPLHGALQAGYNDGWAPNPIGSHYAVRTAALRELVHRDAHGVRAVGGLGPELAEDHTTGLAMNANGWRGAFAIDAIAHGEGACSLADSVTQEFQWCRSLMNVLLRWAPGYWGGLSRRLKLQYGFAQLWYPLFAAYMLAVYLMPVLALVFRMPWVSVTYIQFLWHMALPTAACILPICWLRRQRWLRPAEAKVAGWETVLFQFIRWPWSLFACVQAIVGHLLKREF
ncbi:MAG TPA: glycosyltransferase, partial [Chloroflexota bacterium]|nr:glycosyltransferase [Chloroflexota bacterium]